MNNNKANMVVMSHLSDVQELINLNLKENVNECINFVKYIIIQTNGDLTKKIDADKLWLEFKEK